MTPIDKAEALIAKMPDNELAGVSFRAILERNPILTPLSVLEILKRKAESGRELSPLDKRVQATSTAMLAKAREIYAEIYADLEKTANEDIPAKIAEIMQRIAETHNK